LDFDAMAAAMAVEPRPVVARHLEALGYPFRSSFDEGDGESLATLAAWCEDRKIRLWEIGARAPLRRPGAAWEAGFHAYLAELECPVPWGPAAPARRAGVSWLLSQALECDFDDDAERIDRDARALRSSGAGGDASAAAVQGVCAALGVTAKSENDLDSAILAAAAAAAAANDAADAAPGPDAAAFPLGFATGHADVDAAALVLRLHYVADLRDLQDRINGILVKAQNFVANPVTNATLGKVGR
jgi:RLL motif-containing protein 1